MSAPESQLGDFMVPVRDEVSGVTRMAALSSGHVPPVHHEGDVLAGRYRLLARLGEGGMGTIWRARSLVLEVDVAVKVVKRSAASPKACERLLREARAAASLAHPSIVRVLDFGMTDDGEPFLVMQLLQGKSLGVWLHERGRLPAATAVQLLLPIVGALVEVHRLGIVHRDIKPENVVIEEGPGGQLIPRLVDFGIAKQSSGEEIDLTQSGVLVGSPAYMSPEQARGRHEVNPQSDIWSLCVMLYEMITDKRPFEGPNHGAILFAVFADAPVPTHHQGAGDEELWEILSRGLAKTVEERWLNMTQLGRALASWAVARGVTADASGASIPHQWLGRRGSRAVDMGPELPGDAVRRPRPVEMTNTAFQLDKASIMAGDDRLDPATSGPAQRRRKALLGAGGALALAIGIATFLALSPAPAVPGAAATEPVTSGATAVIPAVTAGLPPAAVPAVVQVVPVGNVVAVATGAFLAQASAAPTVAVQAPPSDVRQSLPGAGSRPRVPARATAMPLPTRPDF